MIEEGGRQNPRIIRESADGEKARAIAERPFCLKAQRQGAKTRRVAKIVLPAPGFVAFAWRSSRLCVENAGFRIESGQTAGSTVWPKTKHDPGKQDAGRYAVRYPRHLRFEVSRRFRTITPEMDGGCR
jgi:hypothetical protein